MPWKEQPLIEFILVPKICDMKHSFNLLPECVSALWVSSCRRAPSHQTQDSECPCARVNAPSPLHSWWSHMGHMLQREPQSQSNICVAFETIIINTEVKTCTSVRVLALQSNGLHHMHLRNQLWITTQACPTRLRRLIQGQFPETQNNVMRHRWSARSQSCFFYNYYKCIRLI